MDKIEDKAKGEIQTGTEIPTEINKIVIKIIHKEKQENVLNVIRWDIWHEIAK
jgi:hypothetical protein